MAERGVIEAAGGLLTKELDGHPLVMVVRRVKYADWALPKGKLEAGETWQQAALREVREETGVTAELGAFVDAVGYSVKGAAKVVLFWYMRPLDETGRPQAGEIAEAAWLPLADAAARLTYERERQLLRAAFQQ